jgi:outer membrane protein TolC
MMTFNPFYSTSSLNQMAFYPNDGAGLLSTAMQPIVRGTSFSVIFYGMQPLYTGGLLKGNYRAAKAIEKQSIALYQSNKIETVRKIRETYWKTAWNEARLRVDTDYVRFRAWSTSNMKERMIEGKVPRADYLREEAELNKARIQLNQDYRDYNTALIDLKVAMGVNLASVIDLTDHLDFVDVSGNLSVYLKKSASNRPEIIEAESKVNEMKAKKMMACSQYLPHLDLYGIGSNITGSSPDGNARGRWGGVIGVAGHYTIFDSGQRKGQLQAATEAICQAVFANQQVKLKVAQDVSTAWIDLDLARRNVELAKAQVVSAQEDQRLFHQRYIIGKAIALEDFDATVKLFQARLALLEEIYKYRLAEARLYWASGSIY